MECGEQGVRWDHCFALPFAVTESESSMFYLLRLGWNLTLSQEGKSEVPMSTEQGIRVHCF